MSAPCWPLYIGKDSKCLDVKVFFKELEAIPEEDGKGLYLMAWDGRNTKWGVAKDSFGTSTCPGQVRNASHLDSEVLREALYGQLGSPPGLPDFEAGVQVRGEHSAGHGYTGLAFRAGELRRSRGSQVEI